MKTPRVRAALADAPKIGDSLCADCRAHFDDVRRYLDVYGVPYTLDPSLVRGLDYYSRTTWEFVGPDENANSTISGGGRYDGLVEAIGGPPTPGVGFGAGLERLHARARERRRLPRRSRASTSSSSLDEAAPRDRVLADAGRGAPSRSQRRPRLRRPLAQGAADPGGAHGRAHGRDRRGGATPRRDCGRRACRWRSTSSSLRSRPR